MSVYAKKEMADLMEVETTSSYKVYPASELSSRTFKEVMTAGELDWLFSVRRTPMVMYRSGNDCSVSYYHIPPDRLLKYTHVHLDVDTTVRCSISKDGVVEIENEDVDRMKLKKLVGYLEGRGISGLCDVSEKVITMTDEGEEILARDVLLDARSVFLLLKRRYSKECTAGTAVQMAMEGTMKYITGTLSHFGSNFVMVEMFLSSNAANLEVELDCDYRGGKITEESRAASLSRSRGYFAALRERVLLMR